MVALEEKFATLETKLDRLTTENAGLKSQIATLEAASSTTGAILTSLPLIQQAIADNTTALNGWGVMSTKWFGQAEKIMMLNNGLYTALDERLTKEEEYRNNVEPPSDWQYQRVFAIAREQHTLLKLQHFDIMKLFTRRTGKTIEIRSRRDGSRPGDYDGELPPAEPNPFPPPIVNQPEQD